MQVDKKTVLMEVLVVACKMATCIVPDRFFFEVRQRPKDVELLMDDDENDK